MNNEFFAEHDDVALRRLQNTDEDMALLLAWLTDQRVIVRVYGEGTPWTDGKVRRAFGGKTKASGTAGCIICCKEQPVGYLQFYPVRRDSYEVSSYGQNQLKGAYGIDLFIGIPDLWHKGIGSKSIRALEAHLRIKGVHTICADPSVDNEPALRFWPKMGFDPLEVIPDQDNPNRQCILMTKAI